MWLSFPLLREETRTDSGGAKKKNKPEEFLLATRRRNVSSVPYAFGTLSFSNRSVSRLYLAEERSRKVIRANITKAIP